MSLSGAKLLLVLGLFVLGVAVYNLVRPAPHYETRQLDAARVVQWIVLALGTIMTISGTVGLVRVLLETGLACSSPG